MKPEWIPGAPTKPGRYWITEGPGYVGLAFVYDGYPDGMEPPQKCTMSRSDPVYMEWHDRTAGIGTFLRIRTMEGIGAGDRELRKYGIEAHIPIEAPEYEREYTR